MLIFAIFLMLIVVGLVVMYRTNGFVRILSIYFIAISVNIIVGILYLSKTMQPPIQTGLEYKLFYFFRLMRFPLSTVVRLFNFSIFMYMCASVLYISYLYKLEWFQNIVLFIPCVFMLCMTDPKVSQILFFMSSNHSFDNQYFGNRIAEISININKQLLLIYSVIPIACAIWQYTKKEIFVKKRDILMSGICVLLINVSTYWLLFEGVFKNIMFYSVNVAKLSINTQIKNDFLMITFFLWCIIIILLPIILFKRPFKAFEQTSWKHDFFFKDNSNKEISMIFHSYKNAFLGVLQQFMLVQTNIEKGAYEKALNNADIGKIIAQEQLSVLKKTLGYFDKHNIKLMRVDLVNCIDKAMQRVVLTNGAKFEFEILSGNEYIYILGDEFKLTEAFLNIFINAVDALKNTQDARIRIVIFQEDELVQININDNGTGIDKKNIRKIFRPFFTTKSNLSNGIGLSYVLKVVRQHHGEIGVKSKKNSYTEFQIVLPIYKERGNSL